MPIPLGSVHSDRSRSLGVDLRDERMSQERRTEQIKLRSLPHRRRSVKIALKIKDF
jgi:hypothetical protein